MGEFLPRLFLLFYKSRPALRLTVKVACKAILIRVSLRVLCLWEWLGPGGLPGLQNLWRVALRAAVGSTPIHSRLDFFINKTLKILSCRK